MKQKIVIVSHCFLNDAAKLRNQDAADMEQERTKKRSFLKELLEQGIEVLQLHDDRQQHIPGLLTKMRRIELGSGVSPAVASI